MSRTSIFVMRSCIVALVGAFFVFVLSVSGSLCKIGERVLALWKITSSYFHATVESKTPTTIKVGSPLSNNKRTRQQKPGGTTTLTHTHTHSLRQTHSDTLRHIHTQHNTTQHNTHMYTCTHTHTHTHAHTLTTDPQPWSTAGPLGRRRELAQRDPHIQSQRPQRTEMRLRHQHIE